jgi:hypothetical protein
VNSYIGTLSDSRFSRSSWGLNEVYYDDLEQALSRCSKRDRDLVLGWYNNMKRRQRQRESDAINRHQIDRDLYRVVKDQAAHIALLEEQLLPHLRETPHVQDALT